MVFLTSYNIYDVIILYHSIKQTRNRFIFLSVCPCLNLRNVESKSKEESAGFFFDKCLKILKSKTRENAHKTFWTLMCILNNDRHINSVLKKIDDWHYSKMIYQMFEKLHIFI